MFYQAVGPESCWTGDCGPSGNQMAYFRLGGVGPGNPASARPSVRTAHPDRPSQASMPPSVQSTPPSPTDSALPEKERDLEQATSPADLAATAAVTDPAQPIKEYLTDVHKIPKNNLWLVFTGVSGCSCF